MIYTMGTYPLSLFCIRISLWNVKNSIHLKFVSMDSEMQTKLGGLSFIWTG